MNPFVSIIIPIYNCEKYLEDCLESIVHQTCTDFEVILIDDGSTDQSGMIAKRYASQYPYITLYTQKNMGVSSARNHGMDQSNGEYLLFCDADDYLSLELVQTLKHYVSENKIDCIIYRNYHTPINTNEKIASAQIYPEGFLIDEKNKHFLWDIIVEGYSLNSPCNKMYRHSIIRANALYFDTTMKHNEDGLFNLLFFDKATSILFSEKVMYFYRENPQSATHSFNPCVFENYKKYCQVLLEQIGALSPDYIAKIELNFIKNAVSATTLPFLYPDHKTNRITYLKSIVKDAWVTTCSRKIYFSDKRIWTKIQLLFLQYQCTVMLYIFNRLLYNKFFISLLYSSR